MNALLLFFLLPFGSNASHASVCMAQPSDSLTLTGRWEGVLTQKDGGVVPEYKMVLVIQQEGNTITGYSEVWFEEEIYVKHVVKGTCVNDFFMEMTDDIVLNKKELKDKTYCNKTYQLVPSRVGEKWVLKGRWQGKTEFGDCVPGTVFLERKLNRV